jgi:hypothetical protein
MVFLLKKVFFMSSSLQSNTYILEILTIINN